MEAIIVVAPTISPYGKSRSRSRTPMPTAPAVAWKKLPCGSASKIVPPAWSIAAAETAGTPAPSSVAENVWEAIVTPAVVEAVAPGAAFSYELLVIGHVVVEAEIAIAMAFERRGERLGPMVARAFDARLRLPTPHDRSACIFELGAGFAQLCAQLVDARLVRPALGEHDPFLAQGVDIGVSLTCECR